jgi:hypothetical protein
VHPVATILCCACATTSLMAHIPSQPSSEISPVLRNTPLWGACLLLRPPFILRPLGEILLIGDWGLTGLHYHGSHPMLVGRARQRVVHGVLSLPLPPHFFLGAVAAAPPRDRPHAVSGLTRARNGCIAMSVEDVDLQVSRQHMSRWACEPSADTSRAPAVAEHYY